MTSSICLLLHNFSSPRHLKKKRAAEAQSVFLQDFFGEIWDLFKHQFALNASHMERFSSRSQLDLMIKLKVVLRFNILRGPGDIMVRSSVFLWLRDHITMMNISWLNPSPVCSQLLWCQDFAKLLPVWWGRKREDLEGFVPDCATWQWHSYDCSSSGNSDMQIDRWN